MFPFEQIRVDVGMVNSKHLKGRLGTYLVLTELMKIGIDAIPTPLFWIFDIVTMTGIKLEVKFSTIGLARGGSGYQCERFTFRISPLELELADFIALVSDTGSGYLFHIIPKKEVTCSTIAFNPLSKGKSRYEKYRNRWDLIKRNYEELAKKPNLKKYLDTTFTFQYKMKGQRKLDSKSKSCFT